VLFQFLVESVVLSGIGGLLGIALGVGGAKAVSAIAKWETAVAGHSIALAFGVAMVIGVFLGSIQRAKPHALIRSKPYATNS